MQRTANTSPHAYTISPGGVTIQAAVNAASSGDTITLSDGTYSGDGNRDIDFGGKNLTVTSQNGPTKTIIDCGGSSADYHRGFYLHSGETTPVINGLTIENGSTGNGGGNGGGIDNENGSVNVRSCIIKNNTAGFGGGIFSYSLGTVVITNCTFTGNSAYLGGGIYNDTFRSGQFTVTNCIFNDNAANYGGGIENENEGSGQYTVTNCTFINNAASIYGGGISNDNDNVGSPEGNGTITVTSCLLTGNTSPIGGGILNGNAAGGAIAVLDCALMSNTASTDSYGDGGDGGGIANLNNSNGTIAVTNCVLTGNTTTDLAGGIENNNQQNGTITVTNCTLTGNTSLRGGGMVAQNYGGGLIIQTNDILYGDTGDEVLNFTDNNSKIMEANYCDIQGGYPGVSNINANPRFVNVPSDLHLQSGSPCLGKGTLTGAPATDIEGRTRPNPPSIGAYEAVPPSSITSLNPASAVAGSGGFPLIVRGSGFVAGTTVQFGSDVLTPVTGSLTAAQISVNVPAADIAKPGAITVRVKNVYGQSNPLTFSATNPIPVIVSLSPASIAANTSGLTLTISGSGFIAGSTVTFGTVTGLVPIASTRTATQLQVAVPSSALTRAGPVSVTVVNPAPGGGRSGAATFTVTVPAPPAPVLRSVAPGDGRVSLTFTTVANAATYSLKSSAQSGGPYKTDVTGIAATTGAVTATDPNQTNGVKKYYVVSAVGTGGESPNSNELSATPQHVNQPPVVTLSSPADGTTLTAPATVTLSATASDPDGTVAQIQFFQSGVSVGIVKAAPYTVPLAGLAVGTYTFKAVATDNSGAKTSSATATVTVSPPPTGVTILTGPADQSVVCSGTVAFTWSGYSPTTPANKLRYQYQLDGGAWSSASPTAEATLSGLPEGLHTFTVQLLNADGSVAGSPVSISFYVSVTPPTLLSSTVNVRDIRATINWTTSKPTTAQIEYGTTTAYGQAGPADVASDGVHATSLTGLTTKTTYHYRIHFTDGCHSVVSPDKTFTTQALLTPNLSVTNLTFPNPVTVQNPTTFSWSVMDTGPGDAGGSWTDSVYLSPTSTLNVATATLLGAYPAPTTLQMGSEYTQSQSITLPNVPPGNYYVIVVTNSGHTVTETTTADNALAMPIALLRNQTLIAAPDQIPFTLAVNVPQTVALSLSNLSSTPMTGLTASITGATPNIHVQVAPPSSLAAHAGGTAGVTVTATDASVLSDTAVVHLTDQQGDTADATLNLSVVPAQPNLLASPSPISQGMTRGETTLTEVTLTNTGAATATGLTVSVPNAPWLSLVSPVALGSLAPGASARTVLRLTPDMTLPLGIYSGTITLNGSNTGLSLPFAFNNVSESKGSLKVVAQDEFSFFAATHPNLAGAHVVLTDVSSGAVVVDGITGTDGILNVQSVTEGNYDVTVTDDGHADYHGSLLLLAGKTNEIDAFLSRQLVTYTFTVVPIDLQDHYDIQITPVFATNVPAPVVTISPMQVDLGSLPYDANGQATVNLTITNHGLIAANDTALVLPDQPDYKFTAQTSQLGQLAAMTTIVVPVVVTNVSLAPQTKDVNGHPKSNGRQTTSPQGGTVAGVCSIPLGYLYDYVCNDTYTIERFVNFAEPCYNPFLGTPPSPPPGKPDNTGVNNGPGGPTLYPDANGTGVKQYDFCDPCNRVRLVAIDKYYSNEEQKKQAEDLLDCLGEKKFFKSMSEVIKDIEKARKEGKPYDWTSVANVARSASEAFKACKSLMKSQAKFIATIYLACPITQANRFLDSLKKQGSRLQAHDDFFQLFLGDPKWAALAVVQDSATEPLLDAYGSASDPSSDGGPMVTAAERNAILALPLPTGITTADVNEVLDRWNRTITYYGQGIVDASQVTAGQSTDFITADNLTATTQAALDAANANIADGYTSILDGPDAAVQTLRDDLLSPQSAGICATVKLQLNQSVAITRRAFKATLELDNAPQSADLNSINISLHVTDAAGNDATSLFDIGTPALTGFGGTLAGTGTLPVGNNGTAQWTLLPTRLAAANGTTAYYVGGQISYMQNGTQITIPIFPTGITVVPDPYLKFHYFLQSQVYGDDPFTPQVEPSEPFSLGLLVDNVGKGTAHDLTITSSQPKIIANQKGLLIDFKLIGTQINGNPISPSLMVDLGDIAPGGIGVADFLLTSSLSGQFVSDSASFKHVDDLGNQQTSLIDSVDTHSLEHVVRVVDPADDGKPDFLTDDILDVNNLPDTLWDSDGTTSPVTALTDAAFDAPVTNTNLTVHLTIPLNPSGFVYIRGDDPGQNLYQLTSVVRSDGKVITLGDNAWTTHRIIHLEGEAPTPQNRVYLFDDNTTGAYTLTYAATTLIKPTVALTSPQIGDTFSPNATVTVAATAGSVQAIVKELDFYADNALIATSMTAPFTTSYQPAVGSHTLKAVAVDTNGISSDPAQITIRVNPLTNKPPVIKLTGPQDGGSLTVPATVTLSAAASDPDGSVAKVDFFNNGNFLGSSIVSPYVTTLQNLGSGTYDFTAVATDNQGSATTSNSLSLEVQPPVTKTGMALLGTVSAVRQANPGQLLVTLQNVGGMNALNVALAATRIKWGGQAPTSIMPTSVAMLAPNSTTTFMLQFPASTTGPSINLFGTYSGRSFNSFMPVTP